MAQTTCHVQNDILTRPEGDGNISLQIGTPEWFSWLAQATSFSYVGEAGNFTARKELIGGTHKNWYWKAYRKANGKLHRVHIGKDDTLTPQRLSEVALELTEKISQPPISKEKVASQLGLPPAPTETLLVTKLHAPRNRNVIPRQRLLGRLKNVQDARLLLVSAPPGFGKTTLVTDWLASRQEIVFGWFSIDEADNDPVRFWRYFGHALAAADLPKSIQNSFVLPPNLAAEQIPAHMINQIAEIDHDIFLVLDDYHLIVSEAIQRKLAYFLDRVSDNCHLVIISRTDPNLPLPRLRARNQIVEIKATDLRFTATEIGDYLVNVTDLPLSADQLAILAERTEGWIAALQMLALSLQGVKDPAEFIAAFSGTHRYLFDYLTEEVFLRQPSDIQDFLLKTSVLNRLTAELAQQLTGEAQSQTMLETLEQSNLFLIRLDETRDWFRYHPLFREYLLKRLEHHFPDTLNQLHHRAAEWYARKNYVKDAVEHYLQAQSYRAAAELIQPIAQTMLMQDEIFTLENWLNVLPAPVYQEYPDLFLMRAWVFLTNGRVEAAEQLLKSSLMPDDSTKGEMVAIRTALAILHLDLAKIFDLAGQKLENLPQNTPFWRDFKLMVQGVAASLQGSLEEANRIYTQALISSRKNGNVLIGMIVLSQLGDLHLQGGQLTQAVVVYKQVLAVARPVLRPAATSTIWAGPAYLGIFEALYESNKIEEAGFYAQETYRQAQNYEDSVLLVFGKVALARYYLAKGQTMQALELVESIELDKSTINQISAGYATFYRLQILIACNRQAEVAKWLETYLNRQPQLPAPSLSNRSRLGLQDIILSQALIYLNRLDPAIVLLTQRINLSLENNWLIWVVRGLVWRAVAYYKKRLIVEALDSLEQAVRLGEPDEIVRVFIQSDPCVPVLLAQLKTRPLPKAKLSYLNNLLKAAALNKGTTPGVLLNEPLTERELEVLRLLASGASNQELADQLVISAGTIAWHLKNLYTKLQVHNRTQAIGRARELNLI